MIFVIVGIILWNTIGGIICLLLFGNSYAIGWELVNPYWSYIYYSSLNWFGAIIVSLVYTLLCPIGAICYWFYKLCTFGRR